MLDVSLTPTRLVDPATRPRLQILEPVQPSRFRNLSLLAGVVHLAWLFVLLRWQRHRLEEVGVRLKTLLEGMGGLWFKAGQLLSLRLDILPIEVCRELAKLQYTAVGFPGAVARQIVEEELGGPIETHFDEWGEEPFAAASIGQVHRGKLKVEGEWVAVKVQRPYVATLFERDMLFIRGMARLLQALRAYPHMRWHEFVWELEQMMREELDYDYEASAMSRMRKRLRRHGVYVPKVYQRYTTRRLLVTEFIHAVLMADFIRQAETDPISVQSWLLENNVEPKRVTRRLIHSMWRQLFEENLYHGDLHPGNIVLLRDSRVALIDFGFTSFTEREYLEKFKIFVAALANKDYAKAADLTFLMSSALPPIDTEIAKDKLIRLLRSWASRTYVKTLPYHERSIDNAAVIVLNVMVEHKCTMDWAWLRIRRALSMLDASIIYLAPRLNHLKITRQYFRRAEARRLQKLIGRPLAIQALRSMVSATEMQDQLQELVSFQASFARRQAQVFQAASSKFSYVFSVLVSWLAWLVLAYAVITAVGFFEQRYPAAIRDTFGSQLIELVVGVSLRLQPQVFVVVLLIELYLFNRLRKLTQWLRSKDSRPHESVRA
jgi:ubiquinone biosynthesis protein